MQNEAELRGPVVTFAVSRNPRDDWEERVAEKAVTDRRIRLAAALNPDGHRFEAFLILYVGSPGEGYQLAHQLLGTQVAHETKVGPLGLKTVK